MGRLRVAASQLNTVVGDLEGNEARILAGLEAAEEAGADVAVFPELAVTGYPPEDLLLKPGFVEHSRAVLERLAARTGRCAAVIGFVDSDLDLFNAAALCAGGRVLGVYRKRLLPNYAVFDEARYFTPGSEPLQLYRVGGVRVGLSICEDVWSPAGPMSAQAAGGAELVLNINASPFHAGRLAERGRMLATRAADASCWLVYVNQVGGQDELVFDGASCIFDAAGNMVASARQFEEDLLVADLDVQPVFRKRLLDPRGRAAATPLPVVEVSDPRPPRPDRRAPAVTPPPDPVEEVYDALVTGTRDYVVKNGFTDVVLGMSGGVDSSLVAVIAADALGPNRVHGVAMPAPWSSPGSVADAEKLAANLGVDLRTVPIGEVQAAMVELLAPSFEGLAEDVTEENLQGRIRAALLMALANKFRRWLVLICGNKSELAVGYTTVYGVDMAGGFAVIKDVVKTNVYRLAEARNRRAGHDLVPLSVLRKPPSAELRPGQRDEDSLPPYEVLDPIVTAYVEGDRTTEDLLEAGHDPDTVRLVTRLIDAAEWKRRQAPVGVRVTTKAFGRDRRMPITNGYRG